jgi:alanyl-tRNA synthetase
MGSGMRSTEIRKRFLEFFEKRGHALVPSSTVVSDDPSVLFVSAGMQQFKPYFLGLRDPVKDFGSKRLVSVQKSFRTTDIVEVGDTQHLTFFEMLGNFSLGDYFKKQSIEWSWELLTGKKTGFGLDPERISVTVFEGDKDAPFDKETFGTWRSLGIPEKRIYRFGKEANWWEPMGDNVPAGPDTEVFYDTGKSHGRHSIKGCGPNCACNRYVEIWNNVFMEYIKKGKRYEKLPQKNVDTGSGLERVASVLQKKESPFETDLFAGIMAAIKSSVSESDLRAHRILADHLRASCFLIADGVTPSNKEAGYILRRLLRRSIVFAQQGRAVPSWYTPVITAIVKIYGDTYPEIRQQEQNIREIIASEESRFTKTLAQGLRQFTAVVKRSKKSISGEDAFHLYDTYGFPVEITQELAKDNRLAVDLAGFEQAFKEHQEKSRAGAGSKFGGHGLITGAGEIVGADSESRKRILRMHTATHLLHQALRDVLGSSVRQMGSDINSERLRFDFSYSMKLTPEEVKKIEAIVKKKIQEDLQVIRKEMPKATAEKIGAHAFFKEKYGDKVSVYLIGSSDPKKAYSKEFCAGPHVKKTSEIKGFKITKEESVGAGVRRIKATVP